MTHMHERPAPTLDAWGVKWTPSGVTTGPNIYTVDGGGGVKPDANAPFIGIIMPSRGSCIIEMVMSWKRIAMPINTTSMFLYSRGMLSSVARQQMTEKCINMGCHFIYYADDDVVPPPNVLYKMMTEMLKDQSIGLLTAVYTTKTDPPHPHIYKRPGEGHYWGFSMDPYDPPEDIYACGAGAMLVRVDAIKKMKPPYWTEKLNQSGKDIAVTGHDIQFCERILDSGYRVCVDGSLICKHMNANGDAFSIPIDSPPVRRYRRNMNTEAYWNKVWGVECWSNPRNYAEMYPRILEEVEGYNSVVDLGAGVGVLLQMIINKHRPQHVMGYEMSDVGISFMEGRYINCCELRLEDLESQHVDGAEVLLCTEVLEHLEEDVMHRVLKIMSKSRAHKCIITLPTNKIITPEHLRDFDCGTAMSLLNTYFDNVQVEIVQDRILAIAQGGRNV